MSHPPVPVKRRLKWKVIGSRVNSLKVLCQRNMGAAVLAGMARYGVIPKELALPLTNRVEALMEIPTPYRSPLEAWYDGAASPWT